MTGQLVTVCTVVRNGSAAVCWCGLALGVWGRVGTGGKVERVDTWGKVETDS
jgi:hypothetical protein